MFTEARAARASLAEAVARSRSRPAGTASQAHVPGAEPGPTGGATTAAERAHRQPVGDQVQQQLLPRRVAGAGEHDLVAGRQHRELEQRVEAEVRVVGRDAPVAQRGHVVAGERHHGAGPGQPFAVVAHRGERVVQPKEGGPAPGVERVPELVAEHVTLDHDDDVGVVGAHSVQRRTGQLATDRVLDVTAEPLRQLVAPACCGPWRPGRSSASYRWLRASYPIERKASSKPCQRP